MPNELPETEALARERLQIIERFGKWTDHNIHLGNGLYTMDASVSTEKLRRIVQIVADIAGKPLSTLRILDLACLEGQYAIEFARHGARSVGIEGRVENLEKARFAQRALRLDNVELYQDDIRNLSTEKYGEFDVVLCLGVLYHLDAPDVFEFVERIASVCNGFAVFDTYISVTKERSVPYKGSERWGRSIREHDPTTTAQERVAADPWASLDNLNSFWMTRSTLLNLLIQAQFTSIYECYVPVEVKKPLDRITYVAVKGRRQEVISTPVLNTETPLLPEDFQPSISDRQLRFAEGSRRLSHLIPPGIRATAKTFLRSVGLMKRAPQPWELRQMQRRGRTPD
jgi:2-polyprenyl-3-methyl-5-hydroxy-6-metoxy-1,4-benzoquinol methylase